MVWVVLAGDVLASYACVLAKLTVAALPAPGASFRRKGRWYQVGAQVDDEAGDEGEGGDGEGDGVRGTGLAPLDPLPPLDGLLPFHLHDLGAPGTPRPKPPHHRLLLCQGYPFDCFIAALSYRSKVHIDADWTPKCAHEKAEL